ncbi:MAG: MFS transporter, partial [Promethearchaeota archaeon]|jgi:DHA3 family macrolide efflux protein-like MFS transporter
MGSLVVQFALMWWITETTGNAFFLSIGTFLFFIPMVLLTPITGVLADRMNRKLLIIIADSFQALVTVWLIGLFYLSSVNVNPLVVILINSLRGVCQAFHMPTVSAIVPTMVPKEKLSRLNGVGFLFTSLIQLIGPVIGAVLLAFYTVEVILWLDVLTFCVAIIPLLLIKIPSVKGLSEKRGRKEDSSFLKEFKEGIRTIKLIPGMITLLFLDMLLNFLISPINVLLPLYIYQTHSGNEFSLALMSLFLNGGMILGGIVTSIKKEWKHKIGVYFSGLAILMGLISVLGLAPSGLFISLWLVGAVIGFILPVVNTIYMTIIQTTVPHDKMGRVSSVIQSIASSISPIGTLAAGPLAVFMGIRSVFFYSSLLGVSVILLIWRFTKIRHVDYDNIKIVTETSIEQGE